MSINLKGIASTDYGKLFQIYISGVKDLSGNSPANMYLTAYLQTDTSYKPQAQLLTLTRTGYNTVTATFTRSIQYGGILQIAGGALIPGVVSTTDSKVVNYTISSTEALYTGVKAVTINGWSSYNVSPTDNTSSTPVSRYIDFTADTTSPILVNYTFDPDKAILILTYNENVTLTSAAGVFVSTYTSSNEDIRPNTNISYTKIVHTDGNNIIKLQLSGVSTIGTYVFSLDQGFVTDNFNNKSALKSMLLQNTSGTSSELPGPYSVTQSATNFSQINVKFIYKLDVASAQMVSNYTIAGLTILSATVSENTTSGSNVILTVADGSIVTEIARPVTIKGVSGYNNSYSAITNYTSSITLKENVKPTCTGLAFDTTAKNIVRLNFNEAITGTITVKVTSVVNSTTFEIPTSNVAISGSSVVITLTSIPSNNSWLRVDVLTNNISDVNGNSASAIQTSYMTGVTY
jgi:hypothetical protein